MKKGKREYHHGNLRQTLIEAAARLAAEHGAGSLSLREAARAAGVSHAAPYHHFRNKMGLLAAVAEEGFRRFDSFQEHALKSAPDDPQKQLEALGKAYVRFAITNQHFFRVMFREDIQASEPFKSVSEVANRTLQRLIKTVQACGIQRTGTDAFPPADAIAAWALVHGLSMLILDGPLKSMSGGSKNLNRLIDQVVSSITLAAQIKHLPQ
jgi:AcrR family transcriptional regulator